MCQMHHGACVSSVQLYSNLKSRKTSGSTLSFLNKYKKPLSFLLVQKKLGRSKKKKKTGGCCYIYAGVNINGSLELLLNTETEIEQLKHTVNQLDTNLLNCI
jgi:hypothetical protein